MIETSGGLGGHVNLAHKQQGKMQPAKEQMLRYKNNSGIREKSIKNGNRKCNKHDGEICLYNFLSGQEDRT